ncbi:hypothetical protein CYLTODRAFT_438573 [Cylindrobasidium torrendii FP15055 ss-10]|uniref:Uncharacterized protein n=1 Tax=Cylindrobasidium torrendii FP15055 ss-10 TaxID=1314674 RepID=A0A0D7AZQ6_9AGAR|nr:hypothetical protein CYLTODRAFT_438573 [Cylindrobasidium torrendii FP15055 ss-10]
MSAGGNTVNFNANPTPKYINDFSKALASEVRILLAEVGKLRDERRQLQYEIAELMAVKSKHGGGVDYHPGWPPQGEPQQAMMIQAPPPSGTPEPPAEPAGSGWRVVHKRPDRKRIKAAGQAGPGTPPPTAGALPAPMPTMAPPPNMPAWAQWRPNPLLSPGPMMAPPANPYPPSPATAPRSGLFGPPTPPPR